MTSEASIGDPTPTDEQRNGADQVLNDYAAGFRAATKRVKVRPNLHLYAELERILEEAEHADDDETLDALEAEFDATKEQFEEERVIVLRAISEDVKREIRRAARKDGVDPAALIQRAKDINKAKRPDVDALEQVEAELAETMRHLNSLLIAAMAVDGDITAAWLDELHKTAPHEYAEIDKAATELNENPERVAPDFSRARFGSRRAG